MGTLAVSSARKTQLLRHYFYPRLILAVYKTGVLTRVQMLTLPLTSILPTTSKMVPSFPSSPPPPGWSDPRIASYGRGQRQRTLLLAGLSINVFIVTVFILPSLSGRTIFGRNKHNKAILR